MFTTNSAQMSPPGTLATLALSYSNGLLSAIRFRPDPNAFSVLTSPTRGGRYVRIHLGDQVAAILLFVLHQVHWMRINPERASREIEDAVTRNIAVPMSAPVWYAEHGPFVATAVEAVKKRYYNALVKIFGVSNLQLVKHAFPYKKNPPSIWMDVLVFSPLAVEIHAEGERVTDPKQIADLMRVLASARGWSIERLLGDVVGD